MSRSPDILSIEDDIIRLRTATLATVGRVLVVQLDDDTHVVVDLSVPATTRD